uniref:(California timema) hypothetical protein n=1 Tax=Timema californicum TaxID=61474 RepID=A0A7R9PBT2_TIMCA|nr:unnamed protein product [Timema californicum]
MVLFTPPHRALMNLANRRLKSLETLRHLHEELSETVALVAGTFSEQLLLDTASCLVSLTVNLYFSLGMLLASQTDFGFIGFLFSWVIFYSLRLFILASVATSSCREVRRPGVLYIEMVGAVTTYLVILMQFQSGVKFSEPTGGGVVDYTDITQTP